MGKQLQTAFMCSVVSRVAWKKVREDVSRHFYRLYQLLYPQNDKGIWICMPMWEEGEEVIKLHVNEVVTNAANIVLERLKNKCYHI